MTAPEFSRLYALDTLGEPRQVEIGATAEERAALVDRFALNALESLTAKATLTRDGAIVSATGRVRAKVAQACVASGADVPQTVDQPFTLRFVPDSGQAEDEVEVDEDALDDMLYAGTAIDLGEAVAQTLALALDPFPRAADADAVLRAAGVLREGEPTGPSALSGLADLFKK